MSLVPVMNVLSRLYLARASPRRGIIKVLLLLVVLLYLLHSLHDLSIRQLEDVWLSLTIEYLHYGAVEVNNS